MASVAEGRERTHASKQYGYSIASSARANTVFYLGRTLPTLDGSRSENTLVDPTLRIARHPGNISGQGVPYYPNYSGSTPESRRTYLDLLANSRDHRYVFIRHRPLVPDAAVLD